MMKKMLIILITLTSVGCNNKSADDYLWEAVSLYDSSTLYFNLARYSDTDSSRNELARMAYKYKARAKAKKDSMIIIQSSLYGKLNK